LNPYESWFFSCTVILADDESSSKDTQNQNLSPYISVGSPTL